jgi:hypothetical protein
MPSWIAGTVYWQNKRGGTSPVSLFFFQKFLSHFDKIQQFGERCCTITSTFYGKIHEKLSNTFKHIFNYFRNRSLLSEEIPGSGGKTLSEDVYKVLIPAFSMKC